MAEELKVLVHGCKKIGGKVLSLGAKFKEEIIAEDSIFQIIFFFDTTV